MSDKYFIVGDIHGRFDVFLELLKQKPDDATLILAGDVIDRGSQIKEMLDWIVEHPEVIVIKGNHEYMYENWVNDFHSKKDAYVIPQNGGLTFLNQLYNCSTNKKGKNKGNFNKKLWTSLTNQYKNVIGMFLPYYAVDNIIVSHAPYVDKYRQHFSNFCAKIYSPDVVEGKISIHGHTDRYYYKKDHMDEDYDFQKEFRKTKDFDGLVIVNKEFKFLKKDGKLYSIGIDIMTKQQLGAILIDSKTLEYTLHAVDQKENEFETHINLIKEASYANDTPWLVENDFLRFLYNIQTLKDGK